MKPVVLEFSCRDPHTCMESFGSVTAGSTEWYGLLRDRCLDFDYDVSLKDMEDAFQALGSGIDNIESVTARVGNAGVAFIYKPHACGSRLSAWLVSIELNDENDAIKRFEALLENDDLDHVSLSGEEPLELDELPEVNVETFPWSHWRIIRAAVRRAGEWVTS